MAKWYHIKLSLANKSLIGFGIALAIIMPGALIIPYHWMDKLVKQGQIEQAQSEIQHVLANHFNTKDLHSSAPPPLTTDNTNNVKTGHWKTTEENIYTQETTPVDFIDPIHKKPTIVKKSTSINIIVKWLAFEHLLTPLVTTNTQNASEPPTSKTITDTNENKTKILTPNDKRKVAINAFKNPFLKEATINFLSEDPVKDKFNNTYGSAQFARGVWADQGCLTSGCHSKQVERPELNFVENQLIGIIYVKLPSEQTELTLSFNKMFIIIGGSIATLLALITFYFITQRIYLEPMRILRDAADQVIIPSQVTLFSDDEAMQDDIERPSISYDDPWEAAMHITSQIKTGDEYERLGQAFNQMLSRMKLSQSTLQKNNQALDAKLTEMAEKNVKLYESNQLRSEFLANVSHELRTPLNAIIGFAEILKDQTDPTEQKKMLYVSNVLASGKNLLTTVNDLLDLAKLEVGKFQMHWELCSIGDLAEVLINFSRPLAEKKELTVTSKVPKDMATVNTDTGKLQQILFNLLTNAIKFTSNNGTIDIKAQLIDDNKWFSVQISDSGCGIAQEDHLKIFEKFRQLDGSVTREQSGTGLGLAIVKELTERMGGIITVESALEEGAKFTIKLPSGEENMPKFFVPKPSKL
jgi:signal transduction histidine kinase